jgi:predicted transcriptional regulator
MKVLLSIKPEFAELIFNGRKKYEFRKAIFKNPKVKTIVVYSSSPVQRVIGEFDIETILQDTPERLWRETCKHAGITEEVFFNYFSKCNQGFAIKVKKTRRYSESCRLHTSYNIKPPQSFCYLERWS